MPILSLSESTRRVIGSSLVLNDAVSVVKELLDNALDARASSVSVELSANALDIIQVRDNGDGIGVEDRQLVCRRGCTSKIRTIQDLEVLGGSSLGFRGEALASVAELSDHILLTTRVDGEIVGSTIKYGSDGRILSAGSASHPVGTTVRVHGFLQKLPVRRRTAIKATAKTLSNVKKLLFSYAFARPTTRFSLKVIKAKTQNFNWIYAPPPECSLMEAASKIVGQELANHCNLISSENVLENTTKDAESDIRMTALLLSSDHDLEKVDTGGHFISIDGRPLNPTRASITQMVKQYRSHFRKSYYSKHQCSTTIEPFLCVHIQCAPGVYDVNVEPAKDDVLFVDPDKILSIFQRLLIYAYGLVAKDTASSQRPLTSHKSRDAVVSFELMLSKRSQNELAYDKGRESRRKDHISVDKGEVGYLNETESRFSDSSTQIPGRSIEISKAPAQEDFPSKQLKTFRNMYSIDEEDVEDELSCPSSTPSCQSEGDADESVVKATNPWSIARLNAPIRNKETALATAVPNFESTNPLPSNSSTPVTDRDANARCRQFNESAVLPTPEVSPQNPSIYRNPVQADSPTKLSQDEKTSAFSRPELFISSPNNLEPAILRGWMESSPETGSLALEPTGIVTDNIVASNESRNREESDCSEAPNLYKSPAKSSLNRISLDLTSKSVNKPFKSPIKSKLRQSLPSPSLTLSGKAPSGEIGPRWPSPLTYQEDAELAEILAFEHRKKAIAQQKRQSQLKIGNNSVSLAKITNIQQSAIPSCKSGKHSPRPRREQGIFESQTLFDQRFNLPLPAVEDRDSGQGQSADPPQGSQRSQSGKNPHQNRYLAAIRSLKQRGTTTDRVELNDARTDDADDTEGPKLYETLASPQPNEEIPPLPPNDPRAYLVRRQQGLRQQPDGVTTSLKIHRTNSSRLPLETIPKGSQTHRLVTRIMTEHWTIDQVRQLSKSDPYAATGKNSFIRWSAFGMERGTEPWEERVKGLIVKNYRAKLMVDGKEEIVLPEGFEVNVSLAIRGHLDRL